MLEKVRAVYTNYSPLRFAAGIGLIVCAVLLYWLPGGFPPWAWRLMFQVAPTVPRLWRGQGVAILLPLIGLICLSIMLLILWGMLVVALMKMLNYWWYVFRERQHFLTELQEAELLAEQMAADEIQQVAAAFSAFSRIESISATQESEPALQLSEPPALPLTQPSNDPAHLSPVSSTVRPATSPEVLAMQQIQRAAERDTYPRERVPEAAAASLHLSPALARGRLRLVPRADEVDEGDSDTLDAFPEIELSQQREPPGLEVGVGLHPGFQRKDAPNEDALFEIRGTHTTQSGLQQVGLFVVADGMRDSTVRDPARGAGNRLDCFSAEMNGREASRLAIQALSAVMVPALMSNARVVFADLLREGVNSANLAVYSRNREMTEKNCKMGTTMTVALVVGPTAYVANVGNSRTYLYRRNQGLSQITQDQSPVGPPEILRCAQNDKLSQITQDQSPIGPPEILRCAQNDKLFRKVPERYLGRHASLEVDSFVVQLRSDDILLLCSDGLWEMVSDAEIEKIICFSEPHPMQISTMLVQTALNHGGADNLSVVVVLYHGRDSSLRSE